jgi:hypothetical protein
MHIRKFLSSQQIYILSNALLGRLRILKYCGVIILIYIILNIIHCLQLKY